MPPVLQSQRTRTGAVLVHTVSPAPPLSVANCSSRLRTSSPNALSTPALKSRPCEMVAITGTYPVTWMGTSFHGTVILLRPLAISAVSQPASSPPGTVSRSDPSGPYSIPDVANAKPFPRSACKSPINAAVIAPVSVGPVG